MLFNSYNSRVITKTYHGNVQIYRHNEAFKIKFVLFCSDHIALQVTCRVIVLDTNEKYSTGKGN